MESLRAEPFEGGLDVLDNPSLPKGATPAVVLINPKYAHNVGGTVRACASFGIDQLWWTGARVQIPRFGGRLPREERMRAYRSVTMCNFERPLDRLPGAVPVAVELLEGSMTLPWFQHPENAVYVFGPEDGSIPKAVRVLCHQFVRIPSKHCLNLAAAVNVILYDRLAKAGGTLKGWPGPTVEGWDDK